MADAPRVGEPLPRAREAVIPEGKLLGYALDREHGRGRHKAVVFRLALDIGPEDEGYLAETILTELPYWPVTGRRPPQRGIDEMTWEVLVPVAGLGGKAYRTLKVLTAWQVIDGRPTLVTARVVAKNRQ